MTSTAEQFRSSKVLMRISKSVNVLKEDFHLEVLQFQSITGKLISERLLYFLTFSTQKYNTFSNNKISENWNVRLHAAYPF